MKYHKNKGITLVEIIVAIAILAMVGVAVMDAFNISSKVNRKAKVLDNATSAASNRIEEFKINPDKFIADKIAASAITSSNHYDYDLKKDILDYSGKYYYDYKWNPTAKSVPNGFTLDYTINENANKGASTMFKPVDTIDDKEFCLESGVDQYLLYVQDIPHYLDWDKTHNLNVILIKGWTYNDLHDWLYEENDTKNTYFKYAIKSIKLYPGYTGTCKTDREYAISCYKQYKSWGYYYFSYYGLTSLKNNNAIVKNAGKSLFIDKTNGAVSIKIDKNNVNLTNLAKCNIQIVNESKVDVQLYLSGGNEADVKALNDKVNVKLEKGVATKTVINERKLATSKYDMKVKIKSNIDGKQIYELSSKEYLVK